MADVIRGDLVTKERMAKGDIKITAGDRGGIEFKTHDPTILGWMLEKGFIEDYHNHYVTVFMELRYSWLTPVRLQSPTIYNDIADFFGQRGNAADIYDAICREINGHTEALVIECTTLLAQTHKHLCNAIIGDNYRRAIEDLSKTIDSIRK